MKSIKSMLVLLVLSGLGALCLLAGAAMIGNHLSRQAVVQSLDAKDLTADILPPPLYLIELRLVLSRAVEGTLALDKAEAERARLDKEYRERIAFWQGHPLYGLETHVLGNQHAEAQKLLAAAPAVIKALASNDAAAAQAALKVADAHYQAHRAGVDTTVKYATSFADGTVSDAERIDRFVFAAGLALFLLSATVLAWVGWFVGRAVWHAAGGEPYEAAAIANAVAHGDLSVHVPVRSGDTTSVMAAMAHMCRQLSQTVGEVRASSEMIANGTREIASGNQDLSDRTERQASSLQQTASAMEQISGTVQHTAETANEATRLAQSASDVAARGAQAVQHMVATMDEITQSSRKIADITSVIDGIAFQTNILALNAAVEAARAGEQGRGFAVVASEVRSLAQRSAAAAREISALISGSVAKVEAGAIQAGTAGKTMNEIVGQVRQVTDLIAEISTATREQTGGIGMVSGAVTELDSSTQQNAALVEQSAAAAASLSAQAAKLVSTVSVFRVHGGMVTVPA